MYKYKLRPGYKSSDLLIEFCIKSANDEFIESLYKAISGINVKQLGTTDLWMNDEVLIELESDFGHFEISIDIWDGVFVMSPNNQAVVLKIDEILSKHNKFTKLTVDFDEYK